VTEVQYFDQRLFVLAEFVQPEPSDLAFPGDIKFAIVQREFRVTIGAFALGYWLEKDNSTELQVPTPL
jgi:hypothetical protein